MYFWYFKSKWNKLKWAIFMRMKIEDIFLTFNAQWTLVNLLKIWSLLPRSFQCTLLSKFGQIVCFFSSAPLKKSYIKTYFLRQIKHRLIFFFFLIVKSGKFETKLRILKLQWQKFSLCRRQTFFINCFFFSLFLIIFEITREKQA